MATAPRNAGTQGEPLPLSVSLLSPSLFLHYPITVANVRILCDRDSKESRGQSSLTTVLHFVRQTFQREGIQGLYKGGHVFLLHSALKEALRFLADRAFQLAEQRELFSRSLSPVDARRSSSSKGGKTTDSTGGSSNSDSKGKSEDGRLLAKLRKPYLLRVAAKYSIDAICYPILLASTRAVILPDGSGSVWQHVRTWSREEGVMSMFSGLAAFLMSTALDELMEVVLAGCIDYAATGSEIDATDKLLLKASGSSVAAIFTAPVQYIGIIQRCQSRVEGMPEPEPLAELIRSLPWKGSANQFLLYGGIMALNVKLIQWKIQLQNEPENQEENE